MVSRIHVIGDSHCLAFSGIKFCHVHHVGPKTMFSLRKDNWILGQPFRLDRFGVVSGDYVIHVFGEIDVRVHVERIAIRQQVSIDTILDDLVDNYLRVIQEQSKTHGTIPIVASVVPPSDLQNNPYFPFYGQLSQRVAIQEELNAKLRRECENRSILYLDYASYYRKPNGSLNHDLSDGHVHVEARYNFLIRDQLSCLIPQVDI